MNSYKICSNCGQKKVGSNNAWFQDFTNQPILCKKCINDYTKNIKKEEKNRSGLNKMTDDIWGEIVDVQHELEDTLRALIEVDWDSNTGKLKIQRFIKQLDELYEGLDND